MVEAKRKQKLESTGYLKRKQHNESGELSKPVVTERDR